MKRESYLRRRLHTLRVLHDAVAAMRSLAAHHFRKLRKTLPTARAYRAEIETVVAEIGIDLLLSNDAPGGLLVIASDLGLCGDYNSRLAQQTLIEHHNRQLGPVFSVGRRLKPMLSRAGLVPQRSYDAPASLEGLASLLLTLGQNLLEDFMTLRIGSLYVVSARFDGIGHFTPVCTPLLPITPQLAKVPFRRSPYISHEHLTAVAVRELLYISLYEVLLDALASEDGMRLTAAEAALQWIDQTEAQTARKLRSSRSESATQELLDIVAPAKPLYGRDCQEGAP